MAQASSNCLYLSKCGITKGYLLQSSRALQLAQRPLKNFNSYKALHSAEAVKLRQIPKRAWKAFTKKFIWYSSQLFLERDAIPCNFQNFFEMLCKHALEVIQLMDILQEETCWNFSIFFGTKESKIIRNDIGTEIILVTIK